jgi:DNA (cytosine-5)-methyltransferase 1
MNRPRLLDLFCGAGGAAVGYHRAGFDIEGVDIAPQPHYPFAFHQADALTFPLAGFDAIHASPPCQHYTRYRNAVPDITDRYDDHLEATRLRLEQSELPYIIENVPGAPLRNYVQLCGSSFGLDVRRHRWFEFPDGFPLPPVPPCDHGRWTVRRYQSSSGRVPMSRFTCEIGSWDEKIAVQRAAMGVDWTITVRELSEAIPPAYTEYLGGFLLREGGLDS